MSGSHGDDGNDVSPPERAPPTPDGKEQPTVELTCAHIVDLLGDYVDGELPRDVATAMEGHFGACAPCVAYLRQYRFADDGVRRCMLKRVPQEFESRLLGFLRGRCKKS
jgi:hypothetical protein